MYSKRKDDRVEITEDWVRSTKRTFTRKSAFAGAALGKRLLPKMTVDVLQRIVGVLLVVVGLSLGPSAFGPLAGLLEVLAGL